MRRNKFQSLRKFERLEDRRMMAADIDFDDDDDILTIECTNNAMPFTFWLIQRTQVRCVR
jgi:hypothetical protein